MEFKGLPIADQQLLFSRRGGVIILILSFFLSGCGGIFDKKSTEIESRAILTELSKVRENPHVDNPMPQEYRSSCSRMAVQDGVKLFCFAQNTPVASLSDNMKEMGFKVSQNPSTNQLITHCPDDEQADRVVDYLKQVDVPPIQVNIDCLILERFGDVTKDWESTLLIENLFGEGVTLGEDKFPNPAFPGASLRESRRSDFGLDFGYWINKGQEGHQVRAIIDVLVSRGYLKVMLNPTLETVNGKIAKVEIRDNAPIPKIVTDRQESYLLTDYKWVTDSLEVTPSVYADGTIGLKTSIIIGSKSKPEGVVQTSIITERSIDVTENRIEPGKSLVIGGMRKSENRSVVRGVPFFKDIPIVGMLFSSKDFEEKATEIIFILTPSISSGGTEYSQMAGQVREKYRMVEPEDGLLNTLSDPLGIDSNARALSQETYRIETERIKAQRETVDAQRQAEIQRQRAEQARREAEILKGQASHAMEEVERAKTLIESAQVTTQQAQEQTQAEQQRIELIRQEMERLRQDAQQATKEAQAAAQQAQLAEQKASEMDEKAQKAQEEARKARQQLEQIRLQEQQTQNENQAQPQALPSEPNTLSQDNPQAQ
jgi:Flp pilus assembly secretin CpaC